MAGLGDALIQASESADGALAAFTRGLAPEDDSRDYSPERVARERRKLADAQAASSSLQNPLSRRRRRGRAPSTAEELARVLGSRPERPDP